jgi:WD40 repeat protein
MNKYHLCLANYFSGRLLFIDGDARKKPDIRKYVELPWQQTRAGMWDEVTDTLCDLDFIQANSEVERTYDLIRDFIDVLKSIPDNKTVNDKDIGKQASLDKYALDLIACAKGQLNIGDLDIPKSTPPWSDEQIESEIRRSKHDTKSSDRLKDFLTFLGKEANNLQHSAKEVSLFAHQQAWNYAAEGPVGTSAGLVNLKNYPHLILRTHDTRSDWTPRPQILKTLNGHTNRVKSIIISADCKVALTGSSDKNCILWDLETGEALNTLQGHTAEVLSIAITADRKMAFSGSNDHTCIYWDLTTGKPAGIFKMHESWVWAVAMTPNGSKAISGSEDKTCLLWDLSTGKIISKLSGHESGIQSVAMSPDGKMALSASFMDGTCIFWDLTTSKAVRTLKGKLGVQSIVPAPDWKKALIGTRAGLFVWDLSEGEVIEKTKGLVLNYKSLAVTADFKMALCGSYDNVCDLWDIDTWQIIKTLTGHSGFVNSVAIAPNGEKAITASEDRTCLLWDITTSKGSNKINPAERNRNHSGMILDVKIIEGEDAAVATSIFGTRSFWELGTGRAIKKVRRPYADWRILLTPDRKMLISGEIGGHCVLDELGSGKRIKEFIGHYKGKINALAIAPNGRLALSVADDKDCAIYDLGSKEVLPSLFKHGSLVISNAITPDGKMVLSASLDNMWFLWQLPSGKIIKSARGYNSPVSSVAMAPDGRFAVSGFEDGTCILWDINTFRPIKALEGQRDYISSVLITPDGKMALSGSYDNCLITWDLATGRKISELIVSSKIQAMSLLGNTIVAGCESGEVLFLNTGLDKLRHGPSITTVRKIWDLGLDQFQDLSADCPVCGHRFLPPPSVLTAIEELTAIAALSPEQSSCLDLPDEAWENTALIDKCPKCSETLKFNPFIA